MRPEFGCAVHDLAFATNDPTTHGLIRYYVYQALTLWEPRIILIEEDIRVYTDPTEPSKIMVEISFRASRRHKSTRSVFHATAGTESR